ncbi:MAG: DUF483 domain-containing protein [Archaeoglobaceae archaeon]
MKSLIFFNPTLFLDAQRAKIFRCASLPQQPLGGKEIRFCTSLGLKVYEYEVLVPRKPSDSRRIQFFVSKKAPRKLEKRERRYAENFSERVRRKLVELEGEYLGYPRCCVRSYANSARESALILEAFESGLFEDLLASLARNKAIEAYQFFTSEFYPCSVDCQKAERIGRRLAKSLGEFEDVFHLRATIVVLKLLCTAYKTIPYGGSVSKAAREFFATRKEWAQFVESVKDSIVFVDVFVNEFIRRVTLPRLG